MMDTKTKTVWMERALELAEKGRGLTSPNPMVGAVIVKHDNVIGEGFHQKAGGPHAEIEALQAAGDKAAGGTLILNLEPCGHYGKTPPCVDAVIKSGIKKVVMAMKDPNPKVNGKGIEALKKTGIEVEIGLLEEKANRLNEVFIKWVKTKLPFVILKAAVTLDGKIADKNGNSKWITGEPARVRVHEIRSQVDAILVGKNTVLKDDPSLTSHGVGKNPVRIILDARAEIPERANIFDSQAETWLITGQDVKRPGAKIVSVPAVDGKLDVNELCRILGKNELTSLLIEGGSRVYGSFLETGLVDKAMFFIAPKILGEGALDVIKGWETASMGEILTLKSVQTERLGDDILVEGYIQ